MQPTRSNQGYYIVTSYGTVLEFGDAGQVNDFVGMEPIIGASW